MKHIFATLGRKRVEVKTYDEIGIIGAESRQLIVYLLLVELQLVELGKLEREVLVHIII